MASTRTGGFGIGFRRGWSDWQKDLGSVIQWAKANDFACMDVKGPEEAKQLTDAGLGIGSVDLPGWKDLINADAAVRDKAVDVASKFIRDAAAVGARNFFTVMLPADPAKKRSENFDLMVAGFKPLMKVLEACKSQIVIEGWPGPGALCCTPETCRAFLKAMGSKAAGVNYDPSHLLRMGIDPIRFVREFADRVFHVHGKDTEMLGERQYELGTEQPATLAAGIAFGGGHWRYTIPGHGCMRWTEAFKILAAAGYKGFVSIELEDGNFNGTTEGEQRGLVLGRQYLEGC